MVALNHATPLHCTFRFVGGTRCDIVGLSLVTNPVKKYAVVFQQDKRGNEIEYSYNYIDALMYYWQKPYQFWNYYVIDNNIGNVIRFYKI